jgi:hypothetical protein
MSFYGKVSAWAYLVLYLLGTIEKTAQQIVLMVYDLTQIN